MNAPADLPRQDQTSFTLALALTDDMRKQMSQGENALAEVQAYTIESAADAQLVAEEMNGYKRFLVRLEELRKGFIAPAREIIKNAEALFGPSIDGCEKAEAHCKGLLSAWDAKERARIALENSLREEEARRARQKAEQEAAIARARAEEEAAAKRKQAEEAEAARKRAEAEGNAKAAAEAAAKAAKLNQQADAAIENGTAKATAAHMAAAAVSTAAAPAAITKIAGASMRDNWIARLKPDTTVDQAKALIVKAITQDNRTDLLGLLELDTGSVNKMAKALKGAMNVPGFDAKNEPVVAGSRK